MIPALRALVLPVLALAATRTLTADAPPSPSPAAQEQMMARVEQFVVRDVVQPDGSLLRSQEVVVQVHTAMGVSAFGQLVVPYVEGYGEVTFDRTVIESSDGRRTEVKDGTLEDINPLGLSDSPFPADLRLKRLTVPGLVPGDRLSYRATTRQKPLYPEKTFGSYQFQAGPLFARQVYELDVPSDLSLTIHRKTSLAEWEALPSPPGRRVRRLTLAVPRDPSEDDEEALEDAREPDVIYTTFRSWEEVGRWWWAFSKDRFQADDAVRTEAARIGPGKADPRAHLDALYRFVGSQIRYLNVGFGSGRLQPMPASEVLSKRYADCKGKHALLAALGAASGFEVWPVLVSHQQDSLHDDAPSPDQFDHLVSVVRTGPDPSQWTWMDATEAWAPLGLLSPSLRGKRGLLVDDKGGRLVEVPERPPFSTRRTVESSATLEAAGPLRAKVRWIVRGDLEPLMRAAFRVLGPEQRQKVAQKLAAEWTKGEVSAVSSSDPSDLSEPFWMEYEVVHRMTSRAFEKDWDLWLPLPDFELPEAEDATARPVKVRIDDEVVQRASVEIPEGMKARAPLSITLDRPFARYRSKYSVEGRALRIERRLEVRQREIPAEQAQAWEAFRRAVETDRKQEFPIEAFKAPGEAPADANALNGAGNDALDKGDAAKAEGLLRKAVEADPSHKWAWNNLGRALRRQKKTEEALKAFARQIEIDPFDLYAYGNRGAMLAFDLDRREEGEKDLLKQIEVAPFEIHAYRDLAYLRTLQLRFAEAADVLERAVAVKPNDREAWLKLTWARARAGKGDVAEAARRSRALDDSPRVAIIGARALWAAGDLPGAAAVAREAAPRLFARLDADDPQRFSDPLRERDLLFVGEAWRLQGAAAFAAGDLGAAERYLVASWELAGTPDGAVDLARLRRSQGRGEEALAALQQASWLKAWRENAAKAELERTVEEPARRAALLAAGNGEMAKRQILPLRGDPPSEQPMIPLKLLVDQRGRILDVRPEKEDDEAKLEPLRPRVLGATLPPADVDGAAFKLVRGGVLTCFPQTGCSLGLALYGDEVATVLER